jgi:DNA polymerase III epsilon subunit-like protein
MKYELYVCDTETTGIDPLKNEPIEISLYRLKTDEQKTWQLKPLNFDTIQADALRVNGHLLEDLKGLTKEGRERYETPNKVLVDIENWLMEDGERSENRVLVGQNITFDRAMLLHLWNKCNSPGTFPFSPKYGMDTMQVELFLNLCSDKEADGYSLKNLTKKYGVHNSKAHSAEADTKATVEVFRKQIEFFRKALGKNA